MADQNLRGWLEDQGTTTGGTQNASSSSSVLRPEDDIFGGAGASNPYLVQEAVNAGYVAQNNRWTTYSTLFKTDFGVVDTVTGKTESIGGLESPYKPSFDVKEALSADALAFHNGTDKSFGAQMSANVYDLLSQLDSSKMNVDSTATGVASAVAGIFDNPNNYTQNDYYHTQAGKWLAGANAISAKKAEIKAETEQGRTDLGKFILGVTQQTFDQAVDRVLAAPLDLMTGGQFSTILMGIRAGSSEFVQGMNQQMNSNLNNGANPFEDKMKLDTGDIWARAIERGVTSYLSENFFDASIAGGAGWADGLLAGTRSFVEKMVGNKLLTNVFMCGLEEAIEEVANNGMDLFADWVGMKIGLGTDTLGWGWQKEDGSFDWAGFGQDTLNAALTAAVSASLSGVSRTFTANINQQKLNYNQQQIEGYSAMPTNNLIANLSKQGKRAYAEWLQQHPEATNEEKFSWLYGKAHTDSSIFKSDFDVKRFAERFKSNLENIENYNSENEEIIIKATGDAVRQAVSEPQTQEEARRIMQEMMESELAQKQGIDTSVEAAEAAKLQAEVDARAPVSNVETDRDAIQEHIEQTTRAQESQVSVDDMLTFVNASGIEINQRLRVLIDRYLHNKTNMSVVEQRQLELGLRELYQKAMQQADAEGVDWSDSDAVAEFLSTPDSAKPTTQATTETVETPTEEVKPAAQETQQKPKKVSRHELKQTEIDRIKEKNPELYDAVMRITNNEMGPNDYELMKKYGIENVVSKTSNAKTTVYINNDSEYADQVNQSTGTSPNQYGRTHEQVVSNNKGGKADYKYYQPVSGANDSIRVIAERLDIPYDLAADLYAGNARTGVEGLEIGSQEYNSLMARLNHYSESGYKLSVKEYTSEKGKKYIAVEREGRAAERFNFRRSNNENSISEGVQPGRNIHNTQNPSGPELSVRSEENQGAQQTGEGNAQQTVEEVKIRRSKNQKDAEEAKLHGVSETAVKMVQQFRQAIAEGSMLENPDLARQTITTIQNEGYDSVELKTSESGNYYIIFRNSENDRYKSVKIGSSYVTSGVFDFLKKGDTTQEFVQTETPTVETPVEEAPIQTPIAEAAAEETTPVVEKTKEERLAEIQRNIKQNEEDNQWLNKNKTRDFSTDAEYIERRSRLYGNFKNEIEKIEENHKGELSLARTIIDNYLKDGQPDYISVSSTAQNGRYFDIVLSNGCRVQGNVATDKGSALINVLDKNGKALYTHNEMYGDLSIRNKLTQEIPTLRFAGYLGNALTKAGIGTNVEIVGNYTETAPTVEESFLGATTSRTNNYTTVNSYEEAMAANPITTTINYGSSVTFLRIGTNDFYETQMLQRKASDVSQADVNKFVSEILTKHFTGLDVNVVALPSAGIVSTSEANGLTEEQLRDYAAPAVYDDETNTIYIAYGLELVGEGESFDSGRIYACDVAHEAGHAKVQAEAERSQIDRLAAAMQDTTILDLVIQRHGNVTDNSFADELLADLCQWAVYPESFDGEYAAMLEHVATWGAFDQTDINYSLDNMIEYFEMYEPKKTHLQEIINNGLAVSREGVPSVHKAAPRQAVEYTNDEQGINDYTFDQVREFVTSQFGDTQQARNIVSQILTEAKITHANGLPYASEIKSRYVNGNFEVNGYVKNHEAAFNYLTDNFEEVQRRYNEIKITQDEQAAISEAQREGALITRTWQGIAEYNGVEFAAPHATAVSQMGKKASKGEPYVDIYGITHSAEEVAELFNKVGTHLDSEGKTVYGVKLTGGIISNAGYKTPGEAVAATLNNQNNFIAPVFKVMTKKYVVTDSKNNQTTEELPNWYFVRGNGETILVSTEALMEGVRSKLFGDVANKNGILANATPERIQQFLDFIANKNIRTIRTRLARAIAGDYAEGQEDMLITMGQTEAVSDALGFGRDSNGNPIPLSQQIEVLTKAASDENYETLNMDYIRMDTESDLYNHTLDALYNKETGEGILANGITIPGFGHMNFEGMTSGDAKEGRLRFLNDTNFAAIRNIYHERGIMDANGDVNMAKFSKQYYEVAKWFTHAGNDWTPSTAMVDSEGNQLIDTRRCLVIDDLTNEVKGVMHALATYNGTEYRMTNDDSWSFDFTDGCAWTSQYVGGEGYRQFRGDVGTGLKGIIQSFPLAEALVANGTYQYPSKWGEMVDLCKLDKNGKPVLDEEGKPIMLIDTIISDGSFKFGKFFRSNADFQQTWANAGMGFRFLQTWDSRASSFFDEESRDEEINAAHAAVNNEDIMVEGMTPSDFQEMWIDIISNPKRIDPATQAGRAMPTSSQEVATRIEYDYLTKLAWNAKTIAFKKAALCGKAQMGPSSTGMQAYCKIAPATDSYKIKNTVVGEAAELARGALIGARANEKKIGKVLMPDIIGVIETMQEIAKHTIDPNYEIDMSKLGRLKAGEVAFADTDLSIGRDEYIASRYPLQSAANLAKVKNKALEYGQYTIRLLDGKDHPLSDFLIDEGVYLNIQDTLCMKWDGDFDGDHAFFSRELSMIESFEAYERFIEEEKAKCDEMIKNGDYSHPFATDINGEHMTLALEGGITFDHVTADVLRKLTGAVDNLFAQDKSQALSMAEGIRSAMSAPGIGYFDSCIAAIWGTDRKADGTLYTNAEKMADTNMFAVGYIVSIDAVKTGFFPQTLLTSLEGIVNKINPRVSNATTIDGVTLAEERTRPLDPVNKTYMPPMQVPLGQYYGYKSKSDAYRAAFLGSSTLVERRNAAQEFAQDTESQIITDASRQNTESETWLERLDWVNKANVVAPHNSHIRGALIATYEIKKHMAAKYLANMRSNADMDLTTQEVKNNFLTRRNSKGEYELTRWGAEVIQKNKKAAERWAINEQNKANYNYDKQRQDMLGLNTFERPVSWIDARPKYYVNGELTQEGKIRYLQRGYVVNYTGTIEDLDKQLRIERAILSAGIKDKATFNFYKNLLLAKGTGLFNYGDKTMDQWFVDTMYESLKGSAKGYYKAGFSAEVEEDMKTIIGFYLQGRIIEADSNVPASLTDFDRRGHYSMYGAATVGTDISRDAVIVGQDEYGNNKYNYPVQTREYTKTEATAMNLIQKVITAKVGRTGTEGLSNPQRTKAFDYIYWTELYNSVNDIYEGNLTREQFAALCGEAVHAVIDPSLTSIYKFGLAGERLSNGRFTINEDGTVTESEMYKSGRRWNATNNATTAVINAFGNWFQYNYNKAEIVEARDTYPNMTMQDFKAYFESIMEDKQAWNDYMRKAKDKPAEHPLTSAYYTNGNSNMFDGIQMKPSRIVGHVTAAAQDTIKGVVEYMKLNGLYRIGDTSAEADLDALAIKSDMTATAKKAAYENILKEAKSEAAKTLIQEDIKANEYRLGSKGTHKAAPRAAKISHNEWQRAMGNLEVNTDRDSEGNMRRGVRLDVTDKSDIILPFESAETASAAQINYNIRQTLGAAQEWFTRPSKENTDVLYNIVKGSKAFISNNDVSILGATLRSSIDQLEEATQLLYKHGDGFDGRFNQRVIERVNTYVENALNSYWASMKNIERNNVSQAQIVKEVNERFQQISKWNAARKTMYGEQLMSTDTVHLFEELYRGSERGEEIVRNLKINYANYLTKTGERNKALKEILAGHNNVNGILKAYLFTNKRFYEAQAKAYGARGEKFPFNSYDEAVANFKSIEGAEELTQQIETLLKTVVSEANDVSSSVTGAVLNYQDEGFFFPITREMYDIQLAPNESSLKDTYADQMDINTYGQRISDDGIVRLDGLEQRLLDFMKNITKFETMVSSVAEIEGTLNRVFVDSTVKEGATASLSGTFMNALGDSSKRAFQPIRGWIDDMHGKRSKQRTEKNQSAIMQIAKQGQSAAIAVNLSSGFKQTISFENMAQFCDPSIMAKYRPKIISSFLMSQESILSRIEALPECYRNYLYSKIYEKADEVSINDETFAGRIRGAVDKSAILSALMDFNAHEDIVTNIICSEMAHEQYMNDYNEESEDESLWMVESVCAANPQFNDIYRSERQRTPEVLDRLLGMFKTPAIQNFSNLISAYNRHQDEGTPESKKNLSRAIGAQVATAFSMAFVSMLFSMIKRPDKWREKDEETGEWTFSAAMIPKYLLVNSATNLTGLAVPSIGQNIGSAVVTGITGDTFYKQEVMGLSQITNLLSVSSKLLQKLGSGKSCVAAGIDFVEAIASLAGIPLENNLDVVSGLAMNILNSMDMNPENKGRIAALIDLSIDEKNDAVKSVKEYAEKYGISEDEVQEWFDEYGITEAKSYMNSWFKMTTKNQNKYGTFEDYVGSRLEAKETEVARAKELDLEGFRSDFATEADYDSFYEKMTSDSGYEMAKKFGGADTYQMFLDKFDANGSGDVSQTEFAEHYVNGYEANFTDRDAEMAKLIFGDKFDLGTKVESAIKSKKDLEIESYFLGTTNDEETKELWSKLFDKIDAAGDGNGSLSQDDIKAAIKMYPEYADLINLYYTMKGSSKSAKSAKAKLYEQFFGE